MDLSQVEAEEKASAKSHADSASLGSEAELQAMLQRQGTLRCFLCEVQIICGTDVRETTSEILALRGPGWEKSFVQAVGNDGSQGRQHKAPRETVLSSTELVYHTGFLVVLADVKGFDKPWGVLIDSRASDNYVRQASVEKSRLYAVALEARSRDVVTVLLATGVQVSVPKVSIDLKLKFADFDSSERCLVLELDSRYDLILGMKWMERHDTYIDWKSKSIGSTHQRSGEALASHEPTFARSQKRFWREMPGIGMSEMISPNEVKEVYLEEGDSAVNPHDIGETGESPVVEVDSSEVKREALPREETRSSSLLQVGIDSDHAVFGEQVATPVVVVDTPVVKREALPSEETRGSSLSHFGIDSDHAVLGETGELPVVEVKTSVDRRDALPIDGAIDSPHLSPGMSPEACIQKSYRMLNSVTGVLTEA
ncbi:hypothetical protein PsorP6_004558 [Peronosclerospora sorghi]|uniref:Uncharacterized protein n=1 Tax=Peronosclerospora sorghi TaxID=230839 RepID=A0ACC0VML6_9STRA|nr:hypothetical protein PsorP6_004558 [Peronosclerospora sorghi]